MGLVHSSLHSHGTYRQGSHRARGRRKGRITQQPHAAASAGGKLRGRGGQALPSRPLHAPGAAQSRCAAAALQRRVRAGSRAAGAHLLAHPLGGAQQPLPCCSWMHKTAAMQPPDSMSQKSCREYLAGLWPAPLQPGRSYRAPGPAASPPFHPPPPCPSLPLHPLPHQ